MKSISSICFLLLLTMFATGYSQNLDSYSLIAHYPLLTDGNDSTVGFDMFGSFFNSPSSKTKCNPNIWYKVTVVYDSISQTGELYLDDTLIQSTAEQLNHGNENVFTITHSGVGRTYKGFLKDLKVYSKTESTSIPQLTNKNTDQYDLVQAYPNPFNANTIIKFKVKKAGKVVLKLFNAGGQEIKTLVENFYQRGNYQFLLNSDDLATGIYFNTIKTNNFYAVQKITLLK